MIKNIAQLWGHKRVLRAAFSAVFSYESSIWCLIQSGCNCFLLPGVLMLHRNTQFIKALNTTFRRNPLDPVKKDISFSRRMFLYNFIISEHLKSNKWRFLEDWLHKISLSSLFFTVYSSWLTHLGLKKITKMFIHLLSWNTTCPRKFLFIRHWDLNIFTCIYINV